MNMSNAVTRILDKMVGKREKLEVGPPPAPRPLEDFPEYARLKTRLAELHERRLALERREAQLRAELSRQPSEQREIGALLEEPLPEDLLAAARPPSLVEDLHRGEAEIARVAKAIDKGNRDLTLLRSKLAREAVAPLRDWYADWLRAVVRRVLDLAKLAKMEGEVADTLGAMGLGLGCLNPMGAISPPFPGPADGDPNGPLANWCRELVGFGLIALDSPLLDGSGIGPADEAARQAWLAQQERREKLAHAKRLEQSKGG